MTRGGNDENSRFPVSLGGWTNRWRKNCLFFFFLPFFLGGGGIEDWREIGNRGTRYPPPLLKHKKNAKLGNIYPKSWTISVREAIGFRKKGRFKSIKFYFFFGLRGPKKPHKENGGGGDDHTRKRKRKKKGGLLKPGEGGTFLESRVRIFLYSWVGGGHCTNSSLPLLLKHNNCLPNHSSRGRSHLISPQPNAHSSNLKMWGVGSKDIIVMTELWLSHTLASSVP